MNVKTPMLIVLLLCLLFAACENQVTEATLPITLPKLTFTIPTDSAMVDWGNQSFLIDIDSALNKAGLNRKFLKSLQVKKIDLEISPADSLVYIGKIAQLKISLLQDVAYELAYTNQISDTSVALLSITPFNTDLRFVKNELPLVVKLSGSPKSPFTKNAQLMLSIVLEAKQ